VRLACAAQGTCGPRGRHECRGREGASREHAAPYRASGTVSLCPGRWKAP